MLFYILALQCQKQRSNNKQITQLEIEERKKKLCGEIELKSNFNQINGNLTVEVTTNQNTIDFHSLIYTRKIEVCCALNRNVIFQE